MLKRVWGADRGATAVEYGLIAAVISVAIIGGVTTTGQNVGNTYCRVATALGANGGCTIVDGGNGGGGSGNGGVDNGGGQTGGGGSNGGVDNGGGQTGGGGSNGGVDNGGGTGGGTAFTPSMSQAISDFAFYSEPWDNQDSLLNTVPTLFFGRAVSLSTLVTGDYTSLHVSYGNLAEFNERLVMKDGLIIAGRRDYFYPVRQTVTQYETSNGAYVRRFEFDAATGQVFRTETFNAGNNTWTEVIP